MLGMAGMPAHVGCTRVGFGGPIRIESLWLYKDYKGIKANEKVE